VEVLVSATPTVEAYMDLVTSAIQCFHMQRLVYVTEKMNEKLKSFGLLILI
jgi:hypothetical protein